MRQVRLTSLLLAFRVVFAYSVLVFSEKKPNQHWVLTSTPALLPDFWMEGSKMGANNKTPPVVSNTFIGDHIVRIAFGNPDVGGEEGRTHFEGAAIIGG
jgi:hypothetical protein